jgi:hypothetical protein
MGRTFCLASSIGRKRRALCPERSIADCGMPIQMRAATAIPGSKIAYSLPVIPKTASMPGRPILPGFCNFHDCLAHYNRTVVLQKYPEKTQFRWRETLG